MKDLILAWVEEHKGERPNGVWYVYELDTVGEREFPSEDALEEFLWNYAVDHPETYLPMLGSA